MVMFGIIQLFLFVYVVGGSEILRLRGVAISKLVLYDASRDFTCFDGSITIPFKYVNDDYCDCHDGSDEPGTSACPNGWFHCTNAGHQSLNIPSSRVGDGICDCCDGSDEYMNDNCTDFCSVLGEEARIAAQKRAELIKTGCELREQLSWKGKKMREEKKERVAALERDKVEAETLKTEKEAIKTTMETAESVVLEAYRMIEEAKKAEEDARQKKQEEQEAFEAFSLIDSNNDEKLQIDELKVRQTFDQNKDGVVSDDEVKFFMGDNHELTWDEFTKTGWQKMKPFFMLEKGIFQPPSNEQDQDGAQEPPSSDGQTESPPVDEEQEEEWDENAEAEEEDEGEGDAEDQSDAEGEDNKETADEADETSEKPKYDEESQKIIDNANKARTDFDAAERAVKDVERELRNIQDVLNKDFGHEDEFAPLDGECFEYTDREYTYKLCPFDQVSQRPRTGGAETRLGSWKGWVGRNNPYSTMLYDHGQSCWNGPQRSAHVEVSCGLENSVTFAAEPNRCEYVLHFSTPAACWPEIQQDNLPHDEL